MKKTSTIQSGRTRLGAIVAEFWLSKKPTGKIIIICDGAPGLRTKNELALFLAHKGYSVFQIRYRGTWESEGEFLKVSPANDVDEAIAAVQDGFRDIWTGTTYYLDVQWVAVLGASFGGPAAILATRNHMVEKAIAIAPIIDWREETKQEPFEEFVRQITEGFSGAYRCPQKNFKKLLTKKFYNPIDWANSLQGKKLFLMHAKDDTCVPYLPTKKFAKKVGAIYVERARGGHLGSSVVMESATWKRIVVFLKG